MCKRNRCVVKVGLLAVFLFLMVWFSIPFTTQRVRDSVAKVEVVRWHSQGMASGVVVGDGIILTARHVVKDAVFIKIIMDNGQVFKSTEFYEADNTDLGLIIFDANEMPDSLSLSGFPIFVGQKVFGIGSGLGFNNRLFEGVVSSLSRSIPLFGNKGLTQLDIAGNPGLLEIPVILAVVYLIVGEVL